MIKSIYDNQFDILNAVLQLCNIDRFFLDATYSTGGFYKNGKVKEPWLKSDIEPKSDEVIKCDIRELSKTFGIESIDSIVFDPPFVVGSKRDGKSGIIKSRFGYFRTIPELWNFYKCALNEMYSTLEPNGYLCFKCQDTVSSGINYFSHVIIMNLAVKAGFYPKDLFILEAKNRLIRSGMKKQNHARKFHCYFWLFQKTKCKVDYTL